MPHLGIISSLRQLNRNDFWEGRVGGCTFTFHKRTSAQKQPPPRARARPLGRVDGLGEWLLKSERR